LTEVVLVAVLIAASIAAGIAAEPRLADGGRPAARVLTRLILWGLSPFIYFFVIARLEPTTQAGLGLLLAYAELAMVGVAAWLAATRLLHLSRPQTGALLVVVVLANTGFVGVPLTGALLGTDQLALAIAFDALVSSPMFLVVAMSIGAVMGTRGGGSLPQQARLLVRNPPLIAVVAGLLAPEALAPDALLHVAHALVYVMIPIAFFIVGLTLGGESEEGALSFPPALSAPVGVVIALRLVAAPALMAGLSAALLDVPRAYLLMAAMPSGVNAVLVAHLYGLDLKITASAVAWTTMIVLVVAVVLSPLA
jgi:malate permease and related proteins